MAKPFKKIRQALKPKPRIDEEGREVRPLPQVDRLLRDHEEAEQRREARGGQDE